MFRLVYVFDCRLADRSYILRCPAFLARLIVRAAHAPLDYAPTPAGL